MGDRSINVMSFAFSSMPSYSIHSMDVTMIVTGSSLSEPLHFSGSPDSIATFCQSYLSVACDPGLVDKQS